MENGESVTDLPLPALYGWVLAWRRRAAGALAMLLAGPLLFLAILDADGRREAERDVAALEAALAAPPSVAVPLLLGQESAGTVFVREALDDSLLQALSFAETDPASWSNPEVVALDGSIAQTMELNAPLLSQLDAVLLPPSRQWSEAAPSLSPEAAEMLLSLSQSILLLRMDWAAQRGQWDEVEFRCAQLWHVTDWVLASPQSSHVNWLTAMDLEQSIADRMVQYAWRYRDRLPPELLPRWRERLLTRPPERAEPHRTHWQAEMLRAQLDLAWERLPQLEEDWRGTRKRYPAAIGYRQQRDVLRTLLRVAETELEAHVDNRSPAPGMSLKAYQSFADAEWRKSLVYQDETLSSVMPLDYHIRRRRIYRGNQHLACAALAVIHHWRTHGQWPASLAELPGYAEWGNDASHLDPRTPIPYRHDSPTTVRLYIAGDDYHNGGLTKAESRAAGLSSYDSVIVLATAAPLAAISANRAPATPAPPTAP